MARKKRKKKDREEDFAGGYEAEAEGFFEVPDRRAMESVLRDLVPGARRGPETPLDEAREIVYEAFDTRDPRRRVALAKEALEISADCADAHVLLAENAETLEEAREHYRRGVAAGERALGKKAFRKYVGHFWGLLETRPYMRARKGLADCLWAAGRVEDAAEHYREMLRLNPSDNQGVRFLLATLLLETEEHEELERLLEEYADDASTDWAYTAALLAFRQEGDSRRARSLLAAAAKTNEHVPQYLTGSKPLPRELPEYAAFGGETEAMGYVAGSLPAWKNTPGATAWVRTTLKVGAPPAPARPSSRQTWPAVKRALIALPRVEDEVWQLDVRSLPAPVELGGESLRPWMLFITNATQGEVLATEFYHDRPAAAEVWEHLVRALRRPEEGDPHRPGRVEVRLKTYRTAWQKKLGQVGIDCVLRDVLGHVDQVFDETDAAGFGQRLAASLTPLSEEDAVDPQSLPQRPQETWQADVRQLPAWIEVAGQPQRPWTAVVADAENGLILAHDLTDRTPEDDWLWQNLRKAMQRPVVGQPHRPGTVQVDSRQHGDALRASLADAGIACMVADSLEMIDQLLDRLASQVTGTDVHRATIDSPGVTLEQVGSFFAAAADFYRRQPWRRVAGDTPIKIQCDKFASGPWYAVVMGQSGMTLGLALYEDLDVLWEIISGAHSDEEGMRRTSGLSVSYGEAFEIPPRDLDAAEKHGWPLGGPEAYPMPLRVNPGFAVRPPLAWELELMEGCLRAIPEWLEQGGGDRGIDVGVASGPLRLRLSRAERT